MELLIRKIPALLHKVGTANESKFVQIALVNYFHNDHNVLYDKNKSTGKLPLAYFNIADKKEKDTFLDVIHLYSKESTLRTGHAEFITHAMKYMDEFGVSKDLEVYKALMDVFPKGHYIAKNRYQAMMYHFPKQQDTALQLLDKMEYNRVIPDYEMQEMILNIFGERSVAIKKFWRMMYWMPKFSRLNPWPVPHPSPTDPKELADYAIKKLCSKDVLNEVTEYKTKDIPDAVDDTWILSTMSRSQRELLAVQPVDQPLYIEGPFTIWVGDSHLDYFVLKGDPIKREIVHDSADDVDNIQIPFWEKLHNRIPVTLHEQDDGVYYAMCLTGTSSKDSLLSWIRCLQKTNNILNHIPIVFKLKSIPVDPLYIEKNEDSIQTVDGGNKNTLKDN
ncbi:evolutionarily conserved signaling intermediate in Toll pathway, mitochondrial [Halictus rubicundus]|uniref:evolutionarily conserved signaling intermediate in Toll pathway, mitochondrial n=1 Tax=Halictus rubicundus TaxID=77578 RepID=UPI00403527F0